MSSPFPTLPHYVKLHIPFQTWIPFPSSVSLFLVSDHPIPFNLEPSSLPLNYTLWIYLSLLTLNLLPFPWNHIYCIHPSNPGVYIIPKKFTPGRIHVGASGRWLVWDPDTPRPRHVARVLLASLACSLRSRPQAASRPSASRMPGVSKITTGFLIYNLWDPYFRTATNFLGFHKISLIKAWLLCLGIFSSHKITQKICIGKLRQCRSSDPLTSSCTLLNAHDYVPSYEIFSSTYQYIVLVLVHARIGM